MKLSITNEEAVLLFREAIGSKAKIRSVECTESGIKVRVGLGVVPLAVEFRDLRLEGDRLRVRVAGKVAPTLLNLVGKELQRKEVQVDGDELLITLPQALCRAVQLKNLRLHPLGIDLEGTLLDLSGLRS